MPTTEHFSQGNRLQHAPLSAVLGIVTFLALTVSVATAQQDDTVIKVPNSESHCDAAFRASDYFNAVTYCRQAAELEFLSSEQETPGSKLYCNYIAFGAGDLDTAGEAYVYGKIDLSQGRNMIDAALLNYTEVLSNCSDPWAVKAARRGVEFDHQFEARMDALWQGSQ